MDNPVDDENAKPIKRRHVEPYFWGVTLAKKHPPYVFGIRGVSCVVHRILRVELHWWRISDDGHMAIRLKRPCMIAVTHCQYHYRLDPDIARTCQLPNADAVLCGRCHREPASFRRSGGKSRKEGLTRQEAHVKLGCIVKGY